MTNPGSDLETLFQAELASRDVDFELLDDGRYELHSEEITARIVSIENLSLRYRQSGDEGAVERFVDAILSGLSFTLPPWEAARNAVLPLLERADLQLGGDAVSRAMSDETLAVLVIYDEVAGHIQYLRAVDIEEWSVPEVEVWAAAERVLDRVMAATDVGYLNAGDFVLGTIEAPEPWKASLIRSRPLRAKVEAQLGWPVYAVAPDRGFVYLLSQEDADALGRIGAIVVSEFKSAPYPISTEVWELSDDGIKSIGSFPAK